MFLYDLASHYGNAATGKARKAIGIWQQQAMQTHLSVAVAFCCSRSSRPATPSDAGGFLDGDGLRGCSDGGGCG